MNLRAQLEGTALERQSAFAKAQGDRDTAIGAGRGQRETRQAERTHRRRGTEEESRIAAKELTDCLRDRGPSGWIFTRQSIDPQTRRRAGRGELDGAKATRPSCATDELDALQVRAGMTGVLQLVPVEVGQRITAGTNVARVADPARLKAQVKIPGNPGARHPARAQPAERGYPQRGRRPGKRELASILPCTAGTVLVDITFERRNRCPSGARPDLSVEGTIELEHIDDTLVVGRPAFGQEEGTEQTVYRLTPDGTEADARESETSGPRLAEAPSRSATVSSAGDRVILFRHQRPRQRRANPPQTKRM